jgi:hypothetical protein
MEADLDCLVGEVLDCGEPLSDSGLDWPVSTANAVVKQRGRPFKKGQSGNPAGKKKGTRNRATLAAEMLLDGEAEALTRRAIELALDGEPTALRLCLERLLPPRRERAVQFTLPPIKHTGDVAKAGSAVLAAVAEGHLTPSEAITLTALIEAHGRGLKPEPTPPGSTPLIAIQFVRPIWETHRILEG